MTQCHCHYRASADGMFVGSVPGLRSKWGTRSGRPLLSGLGRHKFLHLTS